MYWVILMKLMFSAIAITYNEILSEVVYTLYIYSKKFKF